MEPVPGNQQDAKPLFHTKVERQKELPMFTFMAVAVETSKHPKNSFDYRVWYLELDAHRHVVGIGVKTKNELIQSLFASYQKTGKSCWRALLKGSEKSVAIEALDFISMNSHQNTHFGELPTLDEFQETLNQLSANFELRSIA